MSFTVTVLPPAMSARVGGAEGYVGVLLRVEGGAVGSAVVLRQRFVAREVACDAGVRTYGPVSPPGHRPDLFNVWHAVSHGKALRARTWAQVKSLRIR
ncbi:hypothetical protein GCM10010340_12870 [Streptomyces griseoloalbus]|nr:hypothetical protein GCM10010340_12870 [Streptomyces albaduncus]